MNILVNNFRAQVRNWGRTPFAHFCNYLHDVFRKKLICAKGVRPQLRTGGESI